METSEKLTDGIRKEMLEVILKGVKEIRNRRAIASRLNMSLNNLNKHLDINGPYTNNMEKLHEIGLAVAAMVQEKKQTGKEMLQDITEKINA